MFRDKLLLLLILPLAVSCGRINSGGRTRAGAPAATPAADQQPAANPGQQAASPAQAPTRGAATTATTSTSPRVPTAAEAAEQERVRVAEAERVRLAQEAAAQAEAEAELEKQVQATAKNERERLAAEELVKKAEEEAVKLAEKEAKAKEVKRQQEELAKKAAEAATKVAIDTKIDSLLAELEKTGTLNSTRIDKDAGDLSALTKKPEADLKERLAKLVALQEQYNATYNQKDPDLLNMTADEYYTHISSVVLSMQKEYKDTLLKALAVAKANLTPTKQQIYNGDLLALGEKKTEDKKESRVDLAKLLKLTNDLGKTIEKNIILDRDNDGFFYNFKGKVRFDFSPSKMEELNALDGNEGFKAFYARHKTYLDAISHIEHELKVNISAKAKNEEHANEIYDLLTNPFRKNNLDNLAVEKVKIDQAKAALDQAKQGLKDYLQPSGA